MEKYVGAILAAGQGSRMGPLGELYPKPLLPVANRPLIVHHLETLEYLGIDDVFIVVGHGADKIISVLGDGSQFGIRLHYVEQQARLGSAHALSQLAPLIGGPFVLLLGDYFFAAPRLPEIFHFARSTAVTWIAAKREPNKKALQDACVLHVDLEGQVRGIIEKPMLPRSNLKGCGIYICQPEVFDAVRRTPRTALRDEYELTIAFEIYLTMGLPLFSDEIIEWDMNFTRPQDILQCNLDWLAYKGESALFGTNVQMADGASIHDSVIGNHVTLGESTSLSQVVVFDGVEINAQFPIKRTLVTPAFHVPCYE